MFVLEIILWWIWLAAIGFIIGGFGGFIVYSVIRSIKERRMTDDDISREVDNNIKKMSNLIWQYANKDEE